MPLGVNGSLRDGMQPLPVKADFLLTVAARNVSTLTFKDNPLRTYQEQRLSAPLALLEKVHRRCGGRTRQLTAARDREH